MSTDITESTESPALCLASVAKGRGQRLGARRTTGGVRTPPGARALFLDFDGVVHPTTNEFVLETDEVVGTTLFGWLPALAQVLKPHPDVALVISSTWRYTHNVEELRGLLGPLGPRVVGATPRGPRYEAILWWLHLNPIFTSHRILDDDPREFPDPLPAELILCNPSTGVSALPVLEALVRWMEG